MLSTGRMKALVKPTESFRHADLDGRPRAESPISPMGLDRGAAGSPPARATSALRKAWLCDDSGDAERARRERTEAAWFLRMAIRDGSPVNGHVGADLALLADLLRRSGDCQGAIVVARRGLAVGPAEGVGSLLLFQLELARAGDEGRHDIGEALAASA
jgi:hypothetical protein